MFFKLVVIGLAAVALIGVGAFIGLTALAKYWQLPDNKIPDEWNEDEVEEDEQGED